MAETCPFPLKNSTMNFMLKSMFSVHPSRRTMAINTSEHLCCFLFSSISPHLRRSHLRKVQSSYVKLKRSGSLNMLEYYADFTSSRALTISQASWHHDCDASVYYNDHWMIDISTTWRIPSSSDDTMLKCHGYSMPSRTPILNYTAGRKFTSGMARDGWGLVICNLAMEESGVYV